MHIFTKRQNGFTLIELLISVVIVGILAAIAIPAYRQYVIQSRRAEAQSFMSELALRQERWRANNASYGSTENISANVENLNFYNFDVQNASGTTYTIRGVPQGTQADTDAGCNPLTLTESGARGPAGCWRN